MGVLIPARDEEATIAEVVQGCREFVELVLVVDDGSRDRTAALASGAGAVVLRNDLGLGVSGATQRGAKYLLELGTQLVITMDGDGAHDPAFIPVLLRAHRAARADLTLGSRFVSGGPANEIPSPKRDANLFATELFNTVIGTRFTDVASGMRVLSREVAAFHYRSHGFGFVYEMLHVAHAKRFRVVEAPIGVRYDACEFHCTRVAELDGFLRCLVMIAHDAGSGAGRMRFLGELRRQIEERIRLKLVFPAGRVVGHPVNEYAAYVFQRQSEYFARIHPQDEVGWLWINEERA